MSYYNPNLYQNYMQQYSGNYMMPQPPMPIMNQNNIPSQQGQPQASTLNGKLVDSLDVAKATEVPIGGYGVFPKADLSEIYIKSWNSNGTTSIITFKPIAPEENPTSAMQQENSMSNVLIQKITELENKIDMLIQPKTNNNGVKKNEF